jgi:hypothetical protein
MKRMSRRARKENNEPLVMAARTIGSTLGAVVAKVRSARELAMGKEAAHSKRRRVAPRRKARKSSK